MSARCLLLLILALIVGCGGRERPVNRDRDRPRSAEKADVEKKKE